MCIRTITILKSSELAYYNNSLRLPGRIRHFVEVSALVVQTPVCKNIRDFEANNLACRHRRCSDFLASVIIKNGIKKPPYTTHKKITGLFCWKQYIKPVF